MNETEAKIIARFVTEMQATGDPMQAAYRVCTNIRDEVAAASGQESGINAFTVTARVLAQMIAAGIEMAAAETYEQVTA